MSKPSKKMPDRLIAQNKKARHDYFIEQTFEAGLVLEGWEVKSMRDGRAQLRDSYVILKNGEAWLIGAHVSPLKTASTHINPEPTRTRKLLLQQKELEKLYGAVNQKGYTVVALDLHWQRHYAKALIGLAKGKKQHDKRETEKQREWQREKQRVLKNVR